MVCLKTGCSSACIERPLGKVAGINEGFQRNIVYYVYILQSLKTDKLYIGHTNNRDRRVKDHNTGQGGKYTRQNGPWILVHCEHYPDRVSAVKRERFLKSARGSREKKQLAGVLTKIPPV
jgi:putative endonuclease